MINRLGCRGLERRRANARLCLVYKIVHGLVAVPLPDFVQLNPRTSRYCHSMTFGQFHTFMAFYKYSFFPLAIVQWNALPEYVASLWSLGAFKTGVARLQHSRPSIPSNLFEPRHDKTNKMSVCLSKTQISLGIRPVWSESSLSAWRNIGSLATHWAHSEDSDQTGWMARLIWVIAGRTIILLVLSCRGSFVIWFDLFITIITDHLSSTYHTFVLTT